MNNDEFIDNVATLAGKWNDSEKWVKRGENTNREPIIPAINELRYAGRLIVDAFASHKKGDEDEAKGCIANAEKNLAKARHDVVDAMYSFYAYKAHELLDGIGKAAAHEHFPRYAELFALTKDMGSNIELAREDRSQRESVYSELIEKLPNLSELCSEFEVSVDAIAERVKKAEQRAEEAERGEEKADRKAKWSMIFAGISVLLYVIFLVDKFWYTLFSLLGW